MMLHRPDISPEDRKKRVIEVMSHVDLHEPEKLYDMYTHELSGGMRQRAALIRTLVLDPKLLLLDEPFSALDYQTRLSVSTDIVDIIKKEQKTAILVTHDLSEAISLSDRILVLTSRPGTVLKSLPIHLTKQGTGAVAARKSPEFSAYFNELWEDLHGNESA